MIAKAEKIVAAPAAAAGTEEVILNFDAVRFKAPFLLRCGALLIDYIIFVSVPIISLLIGRLLGDDGRKLLTGELSSAGWMVAFLVALSNFIILPIFSGQSIGKLLTGLRVVKIDGRTAGYSNLLIRHLPGYLLTILTFGFGFLLSLLNSKGRALHDFLAGTVVVYGQRRQK